MLGSCSGKIVAGRDTVLSCSDETLAELIGKAHISGLAGYWFSRTI